MDLKRWRRYSAAVSRGFRYVINGFDLRIPYGATQIVTLRSNISKRGPVIGKFMRIMAESAKVLHTDKAFVYKVLGKYLRINDTKILDAAYQSEIRALERRLDIAESALQASLDEIAPQDPPRQGDQAGRHDRSALPDRAAEERHV
ncbi:MAG TPA: hypothetical protein VGB09_08035 [Candidatus Binatia bacterium]